MLFFLLLLKSFNEATITVVRIPGKDEFCYHLVVTRVLDEAEVELQQEEEDSAHESDSSYSFEITQNMHFRRISSDSGGIAFEWIQAPKVHI
jgi:VID27 N-terminal region